MSHPDDAAAEVARGGMLEAGGDLDGAEAAYQVADDLGSAEGALFHGVLLRRRGDLPAAEAAYVRAEARGDPRGSCNLAGLLLACGDADGAEQAYRRAYAAGFHGGAYGLGQMLYERGDLDGAIEANRRAAEWGDLDGLTNLGFLLWKTGDVKGAEDAYREAHDKGLTLGTSELGRIHEERGDLAAAEALYRSADERGDARGAARLAGMLLDRGDSVDGTAALRRAVDRGDAAAAQVLQIINAQDPAEDPGEQVLDRTEIEQLLEAVTMHRTEVAVQRAWLKERWRALGDAVRIAQARSDVLQESVSRRGAEIQPLLRDLSIAGGDAPSGGDLAVISSPLQLRDNGAWRVSQALDDALDRNLAAARSAVSTAATAKRRERAGQLANAAEYVNEYRRTLAALARARESLEREVDQTRSRIRKEAAAMRATAQKSLDQAGAAARNAVRRLPPAAQPWSSDAWSTWTANTPVPGCEVLFAGELVASPDDSLGDNADFGCNEPASLMLSLGDNLHLMHDAGHRQEAVALARSLLLRSLVAVEPGKMNFCFFDPTGLGQSVGTLLELAEYDPALIGGKVWSSASDLTAQLSEQTAHIELVIQKYLRSTYSTIDDFNLAAGEIAEPYKTLVVFDFPTGFTEDSFRELARVMENGPRCGIRTLLVENTAVAAQFGVHREQLPQSLRRIVLGAPFSLDHRGYPLALSFRPDSDLVADDRTVRQIIAEVGRRSVNRAESAVRFDRAFELFVDTARRGTRGDLPKVSAELSAADPATWWCGSTTGGISAPIGQKGARDVAVLTFDSGDHAGALLVGRPGSGKSTLLHTFIAGATTLYGPDELELYLIDFKEGVEFKMYASQALPHARCVAIESDREFGLSVLQSLEAEVSRRGELLRSTGGEHTGLEALRRATGEKLPRVLLVFDEFHVLFARNDKIGLAAADLLELLIRQGRGFGIHVLLGSQSLAGLDALGSHVPQLLPVRILLPAAEADGRRVLGEGNAAGQYLNSHGEGILNPAGGAVEANEQFKGALIESDQRMRRLVQLRQKADESGHERRPIIFEGNASIPIDSISPRQFREELAASGRSPLRVRVGSPMAILGTADIELKREVGANVLVVARDTSPESLGLESSQGLPHALLAVAVASVACSNAAIDIVDFTPVDDGLDGALAPFLETGRIEIHRRRLFQQTVNSLLDVVRARIDEDDQSSAPRLLALFGVHRARDLDAASIGLDTDAALLDSLEELLRDGPEVGVHTWAWADTVTGLARRLSPRAIREFSWRIGGKMSADDSQMLLGNEIASDLRDLQIIVSNDDLGLQRRCTSFGMPPASWMHSVLSET